MSSDLSGATFEELVAEMLRRCGDDPDREGLKRTPERVAKSMAFLTQGHGMKFEDVINGALFEECHRNMVLVKDIEMYSLCEHHLLPFFGRCHVAYLPNDRIIGLSKIPRLVDAYSRRLQVQERLTTQIAEAINTRLKPRGVACVMEASHLCLMMRGVQKQNTHAVTSSMLGRFRTDEKTRAEFLTLVRSHLAV